MIENSTGLPDYVGEHFDYIVRGSLPIRIGQAIFFGSSLLLPAVIGVGLLTWEGSLITTGTMVMTVTTVVFAISMLWYLSWMEVRLHRFRSERPASYERWYGYRRRASRGSLGDQFQLAKIQARYVFLGKDPDPGETLALSVRLSRKLKSA